MTTNIERAAEVIVAELAKDPEVYDALFGDEHIAIAQALADANPPILMPDLPRPTDTWGTWDVDGLEINSVDKDGEVLIEWEDESDYAYYGKQTRTIRLNRDQVIAILAAANYAEQGQDHG